MRSRPSIPRSRPSPRPNRRFWFLLSLSLFALSSFHLLGSLLHRANSLGRRCLPADDSASPSPPSNIAIVTFSAESSAGGIAGARNRRMMKPRSFEGLMETVIDNKRGYAERGGYRFVDSRGLVDPSRPASWSKILAVRSVLDDHDWVFWNDADILVTNPNITLERILRSAIGDADFDNSPDLIVTEDATGFNAGVFFVRRSEWSVRFLDTWWNQTSFIRESGSTKSGDNDALKHLIGGLSEEERRVHVRVPSMQCAFNSYPLSATWKTAYRMIASPLTIWRGVFSYGDFMVHLAGIDKKTEWAVRILKEIDDGRSS
ncbi:hypothetical protein QJS10_CPB21g00387 [Acorus calamus]|uniref:Uncharacterized protein n=1 Tax=Acorus calamus TaxID=4465 RepID=A0AAV9C489_ACOCL|nr:hypothetical protein QJS10_CPB21g00387 [Acorus calamus]